MFEIMNIFSKPALQILQHLGRRYREGYYVRELSRNLGIGLGTASQSLRALENAGLVLKEKKGRLVIYRANMENYLLRELKVLLTLMEINTLIQRLKDTSSRIILFGSCATGEDTADSDIDIFIETQDKNRIFELIEYYQKKIERKLSPIIMSPFEFEQLKTKDKPLYERINMGKIIFEAHDTLQVYKKNHEIIMKKTEDKKPLSLKNLKGQGKEIWNDIDVDEYIKKERESW